MPVINPPGSCLKLFPVSVLSSLKEMIMLTFLKMLRRDERGVSALEYAILAGLILAAVVIGVGALNFEDIFTNLNTEINTAIGGGAVAPE